MKKHLLGWVAMAGMLFVTSCAKDVDVVAADSSEATVTFNVGLESALSTRGNISDGSTVNTLYVAAFSDGKQVDETQIIDFDNQSADVTLTLAKDATYQVAFWAQSEEAADYYDVEEFPTVNISYDEAKNNDENRDAFFAVRNVTVSDNIDKQEIKLKRPFAQINLGVLKAETVTSSAMTVKGGLATSFNVLTGSATGESGTVNFADADILEEKLTAKNEEYVWLSMSYVLVSDDTDLNLEFTFNNKPAVDPIKVDNVPVKPNTRTNLLANNNTADVEFDVTVDASFGAEDDINQLPWDDDEEDAITVNDIDVSEKDGTVTFMATLTIPNDQSVTAAYFICTPQTLTRTDAEGVVRIEADVDDDMISKVGTPDELGLKAGVSYIVTVEVNGKIAEIESDAPAKAPELTIPGTSEQPGGDDTEVKTVTFTIGDNLEAATGTLNGISFKAEKAGGSTAPAVYTDALRLYKSNTLNISAAEGLTISKIELSFTKASEMGLNFGITPGTTGAYTTDNTIGTWEGTATEVTFQNTLSGDASTQARVTKIVVTYTGEASSQPDQGGDTPGTEPEEPGKDDTPTMGYYVKLNPNEEVKAGKYLIVFGTNAHAEVSSKDFVATEAVSIEGSKIAASEKINAAAVVIGEDKSIKLPAGSYFNVAHNSAATSNTAVALTIEVTDLGAKISGKAMNSGSENTYYLYNNTNQYYRCYVDKVKEDGTLQSGYTLPDLYKYVAE